MSTADRTVRLLIAVVLVVLFLTHVVIGTLGYILLAVAAIFLLTGMVSVCPMYRVFGISTCKTKPGVEPEK